MGIMSAITTTTIVITTKANPTGTTTAPTARRSTCICEQMPVSELAVMVQAAVNFKAHGEREKTHGGDHGKGSVSSLNCVKQVLRSLAYSDPLDAYRGSVLLTTIPECRLMLCAPMQPRCSCGWQKPSEGCPVLPEERIIKTSILGDL